MANIIRNSSIDINLLDSDFVYNNTYNYYKKSIDLWNSNMDLKKYLLEREVFLINNLVSLYHNSVNGKYDTVMIRIGPDIGDIRRLKDFMRSIFR